MSSPPREQPLFLPKVVSSLKNYSFSFFRSDLKAGIIVGIVALPLAIAFSIASGVPPACGLMASIAGGFLISALGGSRVQIGGATGAYAVIIYKVMATQGFQGLMICAFLSGLMLVGMGLLRWGVFIKYIPYPLTVGFTAGIAVLIASSQVKEFLGLNTGALPADFADKWVAYFRSLGTINPSAVLLAGASLAVLILWPKVSRRLPGSIVAVVLGTAAAAIFHLPVSTIGDGASLNLAGPGWFPPDASAVKQLISPALTIAFLGAIQSLLSATVADGLIEGRHRPNTELVAQGITNMALPFFGGIPATGAIARTLTNVKNGAKTPIAGIIHSLFLLAVVLVLGRWIARIPLAVLAAILMTVCYNMAEWRAFRTLLKAPRGDVAVLLVTFLLTVFVDVTVGVEVGVFMAFALFVRRMSRASTIREVTGDGNGVDEDTLRSDKDSVSRRKIPEGVSVYEAEGALFFGVAELLRDSLDLGQAPPKVLILRIRHVLALDATGLRALRDLLEKCRKSGTHLILSGIHAQPMIAFEQSGFLEEMGEENVVGTIDEALARAKALLSA
ncbi:MAG TPA: SulP family inorganic anion transporter [bacterium]|nr:SulP family inorganic anion transporter [bacterium]